MAYIYENMEENYYASYSFAPSFYIKLAQAGFIATSCVDTKNKPILLPEMQFDYSLLYFQNLHISKKVKTLLKTNLFRFTHNTNFEKVLNAINAYHKNSWLDNSYMTMLLEIQQHPVSHFELVSFELYDNETQELIAGEIGYIIGKTYTSLSGFFKKEKHYNNWGKLQLVLLAQFLEKQGFDFWNLGHTCLLYKADLGAISYPRKEFLNVWQISSKLPQIHL
jgi:Leu/Phe-tRNA-protein transferase